MAFSVFTPPAEEPVSIAEAMQRCELDAGNLEPAPAAPTATEALLAEIRNLREEVAALRSESRAGDQAIASATSKTAKILERVTPDGASLQTTPAT